MKFKITLLLLLFLSTTTFAQLISGQILNETTKEPIFGVTISNNGMPYAFSDQDGKFEIEDASKIKELTFSHLGFIEYKVKLENFNKENTIIYLKEKMIFLDEVVISKDKNAPTFEEIIKKSSKKFQETIQQTPYFTKANAKQIVMLNNDYLGYIEIDGILYNFIGNDNNAFRYPFLLPKEFRKNKETLKTKNNSSKNREMFNYFGTDFFRELFFLNYQSATISHPLFKKHKYSYKQLEDVEINEVEYYQIQFAQKKGLDVRRKLYNVYGEMLISKKDFSIFRHKVSFDFDDLYSNEIDILYEQKGEKTLPSKILLNIKFIKKEFKKKGTFIQTCLTIDNSEILDTTELFAFNFNYYLDEVDYHPNYWQQKTKSSSTDLIDNYLKTLKAQDFDEGSKQKLLDKTSKYFTKDHETFRIQQIKRHQETLKNIKL